jgi:hypothetical protein
VAFSSSSIVAKLEKTGWVEQASLPAIARAFRLCAPPSLTKSRAVFIISFLVILVSLGKYSSRTSVDASSLITLVNIIKQIVYFKLIFNILGTNKIVNMNLVKSSVILDITWGNIFSFPKKYDLHMLDIVVKGITHVVAIILIYKSLL